MKQKTLVLFGAVLLLAALAALSACTEMTRSQKSLCYSLASQSFAYVPGCETEKSCFEKADALFKTDLGYEQESALYEVKNRVARAWFFYNKAVDEMKNVAAQCQAGSAGSLPGSINQARQYLGTAFAELDLGMRKSFEAVSGEEKLLSGEKVDLAKEEDLYESLVELRQILSELNSGGTNSNSYVSYYLSKTDSFNKSAGNRGFTDLVEKRPFWLQSYEYVDGTILERLGLGRNASFPFLGEALDRAVAIVENRFYAEQSLAALQQFPASDFMKLFSDLGGTENSALKRFADLMNRASAGYSSAKKRSEALWKDTEAKKASCERLMAAAKANAAFDALAGELLSGGIVAHEDLEKKLSFYAKSLLALREQKSRGLLALGEELFSLKEAYNGFAALEEELKVKTQSRSELLAKACDEKAGEVKKNYGDLAANERLRGIASEAVFYCAKTLSAKGTEKLSYCEKAVQKAKELELGLADYRMLEAKKTDAARECFAYLEKVLSFSGAGGLAELKLVFEELKSEKVTKDNLLYFEEACESIRRQAEAELGDSEGMDALEKSYAALKETLNELETISPYLDSNSLDAKILSLKEKIVGYSAYFRGEKADFSEVLPIRARLSESLLESLAEAGSLLEEKIVEYAQKNAKIVSLGAEIPSTEAETEALLRIIIPNPFREISRPVAIEVAGREGKLKEKDACIEDVLFGKKTKIIMSRLPSGQTKADFYAVLRAAVEEKTVVVFASNEKSLLERKIGVIGGETYPRLAITTKKPAGSTRAVVIVNGLEERAFSENAETFSFVAKNASPSSKISVFFYVDGLVALSAEYKESKKNDSGKDTLYYSVSAKSGFDEKMAATLVIPIYFNGYPEGAAVFDEEMTKKDHFAADGKIVLKNQEFLPKQERLYAVQVFVNSSFDYYFETLRKLQAELSFYGETGLAGEIGLFLGLEPSAELEQKANALIAKSASRLAEIKKGREQAAAYALMRQEFEEKLKALEDGVKEMKRLGLEKQAKEAEEVLAKAKGGFDLGSEKGLAEAFGVLSKASFSVDEEAASEAERMWGEISALDANYPQLSGPANAFFSEKELFDELSSSDPLAAREKFVSLRQKYSEFMAKKAELDALGKENEAELTKEVSALFSECGRLAEALEKELSADEGEMVRARFIPPITRARLKKLRLALVEEKASAKSPKEKKQALIEMRNELSDAMDSIKKQAAGAYNKAVDQRFSPEVLSRARALIDSNSYVSAFLALASGAPGASDGLPWAGLLPIALIIAVALVLKKRLGKKEKAEEERQKEIITEWES